MCEDGYGISRDSTCIKCGDDSIWEGCLECAIDNDNQPHACTVCDDGKELIPNGNEIPLFYCDFHGIDGCLD